MKCLFYTLILTFTANLFAASDIVDLALNIPSINESFLHQEIQTEVQANSFSKDSMKLLQENAVLNDLIVKAQETNYGKTKNCNQYSTDPDDPKKKKKSKKVIKNGWRIIGAVEVNLPDEQDSYQRLNSSLSYYEYNQMYNDIKGVTNKEELKEIMKTHTQGMSDDDYMNYLSEMTSRLPYNDAKASFDQNEQETDSLYSMIQQNDIGGICGDIHFATVLMGEASRSADFEFYTASYAMGGSQHVYSFAINKKDPSKAYVINYGKADKIDNINGIDSLLINGQGNFDNIGANLRIYKNTSNSKDGQAEHMATLPTPIGRYLNKVHLEDSQRSDILNQTQGSVSEVSFENSKTIIKQKGDKTKIIDIAQGVKLAHGSINNPNAQNSDIFTLMVYSKRKKTAYHPTSDSFCNTFKF